jgi:hypothetical protein
MNTRKKIIQWAPHNPSYFAVGSTDLRIYEIKGKVRYEKCNNFTKHYFELCIIVNFKHIFLQFITAIFLAN